MWFWDGKVVAVYSSPVLTKVESMLMRFLETLCGCRHANYSFPITLKPGRYRGSASRTGTYVVCMDCGRELTYDWGRMRVTAKRNDRVLAKVAWEQPSGVRPLLHSSAK